MRGKHKRFDRALRNYISQMSMQSLFMNIPFEDQMVMEYIIKHEVAELYQSYAFRSMFFSRVKHYNMTHEIYKY